jgi:hypothetical protein
MEKKLPSTAISLLILPSSESPSHLESEEVDGSLFAWLLASATVILTMGISLSHSSSPFPEGDVP